MKLPESPGIYAFVPPAVPRQVHAPATALHLAHEALGELRALAASLPDPSLITRSMARREAVQSSQIEGTRSDLDQLLEYEATGSDIGLPDDVRVTGNYVLALAHGMEVVTAEGRAGINQLLLRQLHQHLMAGVPYRGEVGAYRRTQAWIGGGGRIEDATFVPPPADEVPRCMQDLDDNMLQYRPREDEPFEISIVLQMAIAHAQFETIHPFLDGNGRVGRLLMTLMLSSAGYPPLYLSGYLLRRRSDYYAALKQVQLQGKWTPWVELLAQAMVESARDSRSLAQDLIAIYDTWLPRLQGLRADAAARALARQLIGYPVVTVQDVARLLGVSFPTANSAIATLVDREILTPPAARRRGRIFSADEVLRRLRRP